MESLSNSKPLLTPPVPSSLREPYPLNTPRYSWVGSVDHHTARAPKRVKKICESCGTELPTTCCS
jgi:hypothetical protein